MKAIVKIKVPETVYFWRQGQYGQKGHQSSYLSPTNFYLKELVVELIDNSICGVGYQDKSGKYFFAMCEDYSLTYCEKMYLKMPKMKKWNISDFDIIEN